MRGGVACGVGLKFPITSDGLGGSQEKPLQLRIVKNINLRRFVVPLIGGKVQGPSSPSSLPERSPAPPNCPWGPPPSGLAVTNFHDNGEFFMGDNPEGAGRGCCGAGGGGSKPEWTIGPSQVQASKLYLEGHLGGGGGARCTDTRARWGCGAHMFLLGGAGLGAHTWASRMCVAVAAGASQQPWGRGSGWYQGEEQGPWPGWQGTIKT